MDGRVVKRGKSWQGVIYLGSRVEDGVRKPVRETFTRRTREEAKEELRRRIANHTHSEEMLLSDWLDEWLSTRRITKSSRDTYKSIIKCHLKPKLGHLFIGEVKPSDIEDYYASFPLSATFLQTHHAILTSAFRVARQRHYVSESPLEYIRGPRDNTTERPIISASTMQAMCEQAPTDIRLAVTLACTTGMRIGEICALRWADVEDDYLVVRRTRYRGSFGPPKGKKPRVVQLMEATKEALLVRGDREDLVVPLQVNYIEAKFNLLVEKMKLPPMHFHDLRHSHATWLMLRGVNPRVVQERLGHANVTITLKRYGHVLPTMQKDAVRMMNQDW